MHSGYVAAQPNSGKRTDSGAQVSVARIQTGVGRQIPPASAVQMVVAAPGAFAKRH